jgi:transcriptional regulator with XRE-family HTH domain
MNRPIYAGEKARLLRRKLGFTQRQMAESLEISVSYLSQIESDDRPMTDAVLVALSRAFPGDWAEFSHPADQGLLAQSLEAGADVSVPGAPLQEIAVQRAIERHRPVVERLVSTYSALQRTQEQLRIVNELIDRSEQRAILPWEEARDWFHSRGNHIDSLDRASESIASSLVDDLPPSLECFEKRLYSFHGVTVEYIDMNELNLFRSFDNETRTLSIERSLPRESQKFSLAHELARLEMGEIIKREVQNAAFKTSETQKLLEIGLANYAAGSLIMPYSLFRKIAHSLRHDVDALKNYFHVSFEQACHRLSTLQRSGALGIPFFFCRVD